MLLEVGFIKSVQHPTWLANIVLMKKKIENIKCCVDFYDLNNLCPKDDFLLPNIDALVDAIVGHEYFSFMDGFSGYNQIKMAKDHVEKTTFHTSFGELSLCGHVVWAKENRCYLSTSHDYHFHDMLHEFVEDYVEDLVVK
ncbi:hypothetical protein L6164_008603 [Bauhinia variegata]|uniref:Uncharacterized protein n=1 Tax=Bauhinia variegata TaxID=167791 RepID=A0ACB9PIK0_BAUVA|nr:hypothetical protein L6164_008603 [Bauhinia variegata]